MVNDKYWLWLTLKKSMNPAKITVLLDRFESDIKKIYDADVYDEINEINIREKRELLNKSTDEAEKVIEKINILGARIVTFEDEEYPESLKEIPDPPYVLYMKGERMDWSNTLPIGVIGARECTDYGEAVARRLCYELADAGVTIVSGMARGIDSISSIAALKAGGKTVAVLGCGIDVIYPPENERLMKNIEKYGLIVTEYPPSCPPYGYNFPQRNRIISGLSRGIIVIEAGERSGTFSTVKYAMNSGKDVFAVPGGIFRAESKGTNNLIKNGAYLITSVNDILMQYPYEAEIIKRADGPVVNVPLMRRKVNAENKGYSGNKAQNTVKHNITIDDKRYEALDDDEKKVIELLLKKDMHIDELLHESGIGISKLNSILPVLEMMGHIIKMSGNNYKLKI